MIVSTWTVGPFVIKSASDDGLGALISFLVRDPLRREFIPPREARELAECLLAAVARADGRP